MNGKVTTGECMMLKAVSERFREGALLPRRGMFFMRIAER
jgi:hypothetical protein